MSTTTLSLLVALSGILTWVMQASIIVPMAVVWRRRQHLSPSIRLLSFYVYLSLLCSVGARLAELSHDPNWPWLVGFNMGKIALFGGVYYLVLRQRLVRRLVAALTVATLVFGLFAILRLEMAQVVTYARVLQCALLAAFALAYLEQVSREPPQGSIHRTPLFLVSVAQLLYSAGTVMYFSIDYVKLVPAYAKIYFGIVAILGLLFNALLTLAFYWAQPEPESQRASVLATA